MVNAVRSVRELAALQQTHLHSEQTEPIKNMNGGIVFSPTSLASCCGITAISELKLKNGGEEGLVNRPHVSF